MGKAPRARKPEGTPDYHGHRARLRARFLEGGPNALPDYEMLELLLFQAVPRRDTKPIARALLAKFGSYAGVMRADVAALMEIKHVGEAGAVMIKAVADSAERLARQDVIGRPVLSSWDKILDYLRVGMIHHDTERFRILFLDVKNRLIADEEQQRGTVNHTPVYPREVVKRALELGASAIVMVRYVEHLFRNRYTRGPLCQYQLLRTARPPTATFAGPPLNSARGTASGDSLSVPVRLTRRA